MNRLGGGGLNALPFYTQSLVITAHHPVTIEQARVFFRSTASAFNRTDMTKMCCVGLRTGLSRGIADDDVGHLHGKNMWLIRCDVNAVGSDNFPADRET
jgi:hypothetical protein